MELQDVFVMNVPIVLAHCLWDLLRMDKSSVRIMDGNMIHQVHATTCLQLFNVREYQLQVFRFLREMVLYGSGLVMEFQLRWANYTLN